VEVRMEMDVVRVYIRVGYPEGRDMSVWHAVNHMVAGVSEWRIPQVAKRHPDDEIPLLPGVGAREIRSALRHLGAESSIVVG
jgi:hypothetical protein